jgi:hypothetical protein
MDAPDTTVSPKETEEIISIMTKYFTKATGSEGQARRMVSRVAGVVKQQGANLVHLGNTVFLVMVTAPGQVEIHTMTMERDSGKLAKNFKDLAAYLKNIDVKTVTSYATDNKMDAVVKRTRLPVQRHVEKAADGSDVITYVMEIA